MSAKQAYDKWIELAERISLLQKEREALEVEMAQVLVAERDARSAMLYAAVTTSRWNEQGFALELIKQAEKYWPEELALARKMTVDEVPEMPEASEPTRRVTRPNGSVPKPPSRPKKRDKQK